MPIKHETCGPGYNGEVGKVVYEILQMENNYKSQKQLQKCKSNLGFFFVNSFGCVFRIINYFSDVVQFEIRI